MHDSGLTLLRTFFTLWRMSNNQPSANIMMNIQLCISMWRFWKKISYFAKNWPVEYPRLRVRTLDGHQIHIFEATVLPSCKNLHCIYIWWVVWKKLANTVLKAILTWVPPHQVIVCNSDDTPSSGLNIVENVTEEQILNIFKNESDVLQEKYLFPQIYIGQTCLTWLNVHL